MSDSLWHSGLPSTRLLNPWDSPGKYIGVSCHVLLQGIFPNQGLNPGLPHCRQILYCLSYQGSLKSSSPALKKGPLLSDWSLGPPFISQSLWQILGSAPLALTQVTNFFSDKVLLRFLTTGTLEWLWQLPGLSPGEDLGTSALAIEPVSCWLPYRLQKNHKLQLLYEYAVNLKFVTKQHLQRWFEVGRTEKHIICAVNFQSSKKNWSRTIRGCVMHISCYSYTFYNLKNCWGEMFQDLSLCDWNFSCYGWNLLQLDLVT